MAKSSLVVGYIFCEEERLSEREKAPFYLEIPFFVKSASPHADCEDEYHSVGWDRRGQAAER